MFMFRQGAAALATVAACLFLIATPSSTSAQNPPAIRHGAITITNAFTREPPKGARVAGGYITITNTGATPDRLIGGSASFAKRFEVHEMAMDGGMMKMRELSKGLEIKAGGTVELKPGGYHVMFMDLTEMPTAGKPLKAKLRFEVAGEVDVEFAVQPMAGAPKSQHHH